MKTDPGLVLPGARLAAEKMPGHWLLARLGKRVLRPGGMELTRGMLRALDIRPSDTVVEFAPGLGVTTRLVLKLHPASYIAIEENKAAALRVGSSLMGVRQRCLAGSASQTGLPDASATVVYGEAMLTMQNATQKSQIVQEACRILKPGGRYGIHELCLVPDDLDEAIQMEIQQALSNTIRVGAKPLTAEAWRGLLKAEGLAVRSEMRLPMRLLKAGQLLQDEGLFGALRFAWNLCRDAEARQRVLAMRRIFRKYRTHLSAIMLVGIKGDQNDAPNDFATGENDNRGLPGPTIKRWDMDWPRAKLS